MVLTCVCLPRLLLLGASGRTSASSRSIVRFKSASLLKLGWFSTFDFHCAIGLTHGLSYHGRRLSPYHRFDHREEATPSRHLKSRCWFNHGSLSSLCLWAFPGTVTAVLGLHFQAVSGTGRFWGRRYARPILSTDGVGCSECAPSLDSAGQGSHCCYRRRGRPLRRCYYTGTVPWSAW